jgi:hypothetical protein
MLASAANQVRDVLNLNKSIQITTNIKLLHDLSLSQLSLGRLVRDMLPGQQTNHPVNILYTPEV